MIATDVLFHPVRLGTHDLQHGRGWNLTRRIRLTLAFLQKASGA